MSNTFIYWNFKGSKGDANILRISLPCSYNTIKKKILEETNLNLQNNLDILLYYNNEILSEYESIHNEMLIEIQRSNIDVVKELLQKSNEKYLEKNKNIIENKDISNLKQNENFNLSKNNNDKLNIHETNKILKINKIQNHSYNNRSWNVYNRNNTKEDNDDEDMKIQEVMEKNNLYRSDYKSKMNYFKKDKNNANFFQNKLKKIPSPTISKRNFNGYNKTENIPNGAMAYQKHNMQNKYYKLKNSPKNNLNNTLAEASTKFISPDYICHMCGKKGHSIKNCTMSNFNNNKKIKIPTGIPANFLTKIKSEDIYKYDQIYILKDGSYGVMKDVEDVSGSAYLYRSVDDKINIYLGVNDNNNKNDSDKFSNIYKCLLCKKLYSSPITLHCCGETYCKQCLFRYNKKRKNDQSYHNSSDQKVQVMKCPNCSKFINSDELIINTNIKNVIDTIIKNQKINDTNDEGNISSNGGLLNVNKEKKLPFENNNNISDNFINNRNDIMQNNQNDNGQINENKINFNEDNISSNEIPTDKIKDQHSVNNNTINGNDEELQDNNFNPLIDLPININEIKKQHDFASAYIAQYKLQKKKEKKRNIDLNLIFMNKKIC
ncbi:conserved Plasmodium protein, unknown function [Plasmodium relictum]|uniref:CCHC-type domain-containing protein n=1 Tax=Plasmodium relictum TaxID=85471 RepID=A0A1J1HDI8_PLARL|nr:conserved Plasmodium protein, unknown function [Plasmodium relictum]CRH03996.1 conserved Plasmodium protein, unknown function [Plasmodium relictum]